MLLGCTKGPHCVALAGIDLTGFCLYLLCAEIKGTGHITWISNNTFKFRLLSAYLFKHHLGAETLPSAVYLPLHGSL